MFGRPNRCLLPFAADRRRRRRRPTVFCAVGQAPCRDVRPVHPAPDRTPRKLATFEPAVFESILADIDRRSAAGTDALALRELIDRLCRRLVTIDLREANPAFDYARRQAWPDDEPEPMYLPAEADDLLQAYAQPQPADQPRNRAMIALPARHSASAAPECLLFPAPRLRDALNDMALIKKRAAGPGGDRFSRARYEPTRAAQYLCATVAARRADQRRSVGVARAGE